MSATLESFGLDKLPRGERLALVQALWDSIAASAERPTLTDAQRQELDRRLADHEANPDDVVPWEKIKEEALARFRQ